VSTQIGLFLSESSVFISGEICFFLKSGTPAPMPEYLKNYLTDFEASVI
jgi:hypothetical protein